MDSNRFWCGTTTAHVSHDVDGGRWRCEGYGRLHDSVRNRPLSDDLCAYAYTGPTGIRWLCRGKVHQTDPGLPHGGHHTFRAVPRVDA